MCGAVQGLEGMKIQTFVIRLNLISPWTIAA